MVHKNSITSWRVFDHGTRKRNVCELLARSNRPVTDRELLDELGGDDMNLIRPGVTELIKLGIVVECGSVVCKKTGRTVRRVRLLKQETN